MTKEEFKIEWEKEDCKITFDDIAECAVEWGIFDKPRICNIYHVRYKVLRAADIFDAEDYNPYHDNDDD